MDLATYQELAKRTATHPDPNADMYELMALGLIGETGEVVDLIKKHKFHGVPMDVEKLKKEVGDCLWYLANGLTMFDVDLGGYNASYCSADSTPIDLASNASNMAIMFTIGENIEEDAGEYLSCLSGVVSVYGFTLEDAADTNIEKLKRRYPDGFDLDKAANHDSE